MLFALSYSCLLWQFQFFIFAHHFSTSWWGMVFLPAGFLGAATDYWPGEGLRFLHPLRCPQDSLASHIRILHLSWMPAELFLETEGCVRWHTFRFSRNLLIFLQRPSRVLSWLINDLQRKTSFPCSSLQHSPSLIWICFGGVILLPTPQRSPWHPGLKRQRYE